MKKVITLLFILLHISFQNFCQQKLLAPKDFLGYSLGEHFTSHYRVLEYFRHVDAVTANMKLEEYGRTYEGKPLVYAVLTAPENFHKLEELRMDNLRRARVLEDSAASSDISIIWLSYNVHGDEASSTEAAMLTLWDLANPSNTKAQGWLKNTIIIIDPCLNPDGRERYISTYNQFRNLPYNPNSDAIEHHLPWPGGRQNHYLFDLNRDWAWVTQAESKARLQIYNQWLPQIHIDFHEQGYNSPYYFAPAAEPLHEVISDWQKDFQVMIGKNNARYFDEMGWLYFTKEVFDLYYPSYGDTYPTFNGAIGMTYEQAGGSAAGLGVRTETGEELTLGDRILHHHTTALSTIEVTSNHSTRVVDEFSKYFTDNIYSPVSAYKSYVIKGDNNTDKLTAICNWFDIHGIQYGHPAAGKITRGYDYQSQTTTNVSLATNDIVVNIYQPKSRFITTVLEPFSKLADTLTYDITAWNLMYAYDLKGYALPEKINVAKKVPPAQKSLPSNAKPYAYVFRYKHFQDAVFLSALLREKITVRKAEKSFTINGEKFDAGTLIVTQRNNEHISEFDSLVRNNAKKFNRTIYTTTTGFVEKGRDFGSSGLRLIKAPSTALLFGKETSTLSSGEIWHFFEQQLKYPITLIGTDYFAHTNLQRYDVLIVPDGYYEMFNETVVDKVAQWVKSGGKLILVSNAINAFTDRNIFSIKRFNDEEKNEAEKHAREQKLKESLPRYEDTERKQISESIYGAIYKVKIDNTHPLGFGLGETYYSLKTNDLRFSYLEHGWNVGTIQGKPKPVQGFAGFKANRVLENSLIFGIETQGLGKVVYLVDNPLFRAFWENGKMLFSNAVFMVD